MYSNRVHNMSASSWLQRGRRKSVSGVSNVRRYNPNFLAPHIVKDSDNQNEIENISTKIKPLDFDDPSYQNKIAFIGKSPDPLQLYIRRILDEEREKKEKDEFKDEAVDTLGISGLKYVVSSNRQSGACRLFWSTLLLCCLATNLYQLHDRFSVYFSYGIASGINLHKNRSVIYPLIYVCPLETDALIKIKKEYLESKMINTSEPDWCLDNIVRLTDLVGFNNLDAEAVWRMTSPSRNKVFSVMEFRDLFPDLGNFARVVSKEEVIWPIGYCGVYTLNTSVRWHGIGTRMHFERKLPEDKCEKFDFEVTVQQELEPMKMSLTLNATAGGTMGYQITVMQFNGIDSPNMPCVSSERFQECWTKCVELHMTKRAKCRLPYMPAPKLNPCKNSQDSKEAHEVALDVYQTLNESAPECGCTRRCIRMYHQVYPKRRDSNNPQTTLGFYYGNNYFDIVQERLIYEFTSLLCEAGGNIGLYIGITMMSILDLVKLTFTKCTKSAAGPTDEELAGEPINARARGQPRQVDPHGASLQVQPARAFGDPGEQERRFGGENFRSPREPGARHENPYSRYSAGHHQRLFAHNY